MYPARDTLQLVIEACWKLTWQKAAKSTARSRHWLPVFSFVNEHNNIMKPHAKKQRFSNISDSLACGSCDTSLFNHILTSSVIYYWTDERQHRIYLLNRPWKIIGFAWAHGSSSLWPGYRLQLLLSYIGLKKERATPLCPCNGVFADQFIFRSIF